MWWSCSDSFQWPICVEHVGGWWSAADSSLDTCNSRHRRTCQRIEMNQSRLLRWTITLMDFSWSQWCFQSHFYRIKKEQKSREEMCYRRLFTTDVLLVPSRGERGSAFSFTSLIFKNSIGMPSCHGYQTTSSPHMLPKSSFYRASAN